MVRTVDIERRLRLLRKDTGRKQINPASKVIADTIRGTGHFNFAQGIVGSAVGISASFCTTLANHPSEQVGSSIAFLGLAIIAALMS